MGEFSYMGRRITVSGDGDIESPFVIGGTGWNPSLAAELESYVAGRCFEGRDWTVIRTRTERGADDRHLSVLTFRVVWGQDELAQTEIWFDITEAMTRLPNESLTRLRQ